MSVGIVIDRLALLGVSYAPNNPPGSVVTVPANYDFRFLAPLVPIDPISLTSSSQMIVTN